MFALALLLATFSPDDGLADQIVRCGVDRAQVKIRHEEALQADTAIIATPDAALTSDHLACLVGLATGGRLFAFADPAAQARFDPLIQAADRSAGLAASRQWLSDHALLETLPVYDPARQSLAQYAVSLEALCGLAPGTGLKAEGRDSLSIIPPETLPPDEPALAAFQCIVSTVVAADLESHGVSLGFTGNEAAAGE